jgi:hypothetical protein
MRRVALTLATTLLTVMLVAPAALASNGGEGLYGETNDKVVTNYFFIVIAFFPLLIFLLSLLQWQLDKRKENRKAAAKARAQRQPWNGGW